MEYTELGTLICFFRFNRWVRHVACMEAMKSSYKISVGKPEGKRSLGGSRCRWEDNINMDCRESVPEDVNWTHLAQGRVEWWILVNMITNLQVP
jgi:hypothetical protein